MKISMSCLLAVTVVGCAAQPANVGAGGEVAGTWQLIICKSECSFSSRQNVFATATVVLFDRVLTLEEMQRINPIYINTHDVNACYEVDAQAGARSYVRIKTNYGTWESTDNTVRFQLFRSPDAGYSVVIERFGNTLKGSGTSWGVGGRAA
jgi:hypothetical protein